ncbi:CvpA family protein [Streptococcus sp. DD13]|uniref:CvpA family protein n=1 Tax=Streptococcus sp. DD13 TaxID=1777881 RepID=UPI0007962C4E|nr:CvpA family protein [Streptococcus sp. DD13]KXT77968.1 Colicin V production protein [Streptococcus sp. DD13]
MISLLILLILAWAFYIGYMRGIILQAYYTLSSLIALFVAASQFRGLAKLYTQWVPFANATEGAKNYFFASRYLYDLDQIFYAGLAFLTIYLGVYLVLRIVGIFVHFTDGLAPNGRSYQIGAGVLSILVTWVSLQVFLTVLATIPMDLIQETFRKSWLVNAMVEYTPFTGSFLKNLWIATIS